MSKAPTVHVSLLGNVENLTLDGDVDWLGIVRAIVLGELLDRERVVLGRTTVESATAESRCHA